MGCLVNLYFVARNTVPCTTSSPLHMVPSYVINSTITNLVASLFNYTYPTPRNNVFAFVIISRPFKCVVTLITNSVMNTLVLKLLGGGETGTWSVGRV